VARRSRRVLEIVPSLASAAELLSVTRFDVEEVSARR